MDTKKRLAILGGGPAALYLLKHFVSAGRTDIGITIFEKNHQLGAGMPYSKDGANPEHITNVSGNEIPELVTTVTEWIAKAPKALLQQFNITPRQYNDYKVLPRLLFGHYLSAQFELLKNKAKDLGILDDIHFGTCVTDVIDHPEMSKVTVVADGEKRYDFDQVIISTGHNWPKKHEGKVPGYYDSPYPPQKLELKLDHAVAIRGSSLTAIDAIRTLARANGAFTQDNDGWYTYKVNEDSASFKMVMHSRNGLLPAIRFHLEDSHLADDKVMTKEEMREYRDTCGGFIPLDLLFERNFKEMFKDKRPAFYDQIKDMDMEQFVTTMMTMRQSQDPFDLFKAEYAEAERSIEQERSVYWKEALAILSVAMNYPAKYLCAEDRQRLQKTLMPLISVVIAFVPQNSCKELFALHDAGVLDIVSVGDASEVEVTEGGGVNFHYTDDNGKHQVNHYNTFVDAIGQKHMAFEELPYESLLANSTVYPARLQFKDAAIGRSEMQQGIDDIQTDGQGSYYLKVPGIAINDHFQPVDAYGAYNPRLYMMAVPYIGGYNPDYSGLDFCEVASETIVKNIFNPMVYERPAID